MNSLRFGTALMVVLTIALTLSSRACGVSEAPVVDDPPSGTPAEPAAMPAEPAGTPAEPAAMPEQRMVRSEPPVVTSAADASAVDAYRDADTAMAAWDAASATALGAGGGLPVAAAAATAGAGPQATAVGVPIDAASSATTARWVLALLALGVLAGVSLTWVTNGPLAGHRGAAGTRFTQDG